MIPASSTSDAEARTRRSPTRSRHCRHGRSDIRSPGIPTDEAGIMKTRTWTLIVPLAAGLACAEAGQDDVSGGTIDLASLDAVFAEFADPAGPGCAVAASRDGQQVMARAYGMANLEWDVPNTPETVFEPGSVSKQFTAAATIMLVLDGIISLDDDIRDYLPELPDYGGADHGPHAPQPHERSARLGIDRGDRGLGTHDADPYAQARARYREPTRGAQLRAGPILLLHEHRVQPPGRAHRARERNDVRRILAGAGLPAAGNDEDPVA